MLIRKVKIPLRILNLLKFTEKNFLLFSFKKLRFNFSYENKRKFLVGWAPPGKNSPLGHRHRRAYK